MLRMIDFYVRWFPDLDRFAQGRERKRALAHAVNRGMIASPRYWLWLIACLILIMATKEWVPSIWQMHLIVEIALMVLLFGFGSIWGGMWLCRKNINDHLRQLLPDRSLPDSRNL